MLTKQKQKISNSYGGWSPQQFWYFL